MITDFHTHAFPDAIAARALQILCDETDEVHAYLDGRLSSLLASMDRHNIGRTVLCSIATRPEQFAPILAWSRAVVSKRVIPFPSLHPDDPKAVDRVTEIATAGFKGIKLHPYYQEFDLNEDRMWPIYERACELDLMVVSHTGFDIGFPRYRRADPARIRQVTDRLPGLKFIATHLGAWEDWEEFRKHLLGRPVYIEISYALPFLPDDRARALLMEHPCEYILFGTDSPWQDQGTALASLNALRVGTARENAILESNAARLLDEVPGGPGTFTGKAIPPSRLADA